MVTDAGHLKVPESLEAVPQLLKAGRLGETLSGELIEVL
jgi:hypothetical protein